MAQQSFARAFLQVFPSHDQALWPLIAVAKTGQTRWRSLATARKGLDGEFCGQSWKSGYTNMGSEVTLFSVKIGLLTDEPIRLTGLISIFEEPATDSNIRLEPIPGTLDQLLSDAELDYVVVDLNAATGTLRTLETIKALRPGMRMIVIGPEGDDELVMRAIMSGARAYLDLKAGPRIVRQAVEVVISGSIWAPRRLLSKLIDRLLSTPADTSLTSTSTHMTDRERQVLDLLLMARSNREIAEQLGIEERTVKAHVSRLLRKTGVENRIELSMHMLNKAIPVKGFVERRRGERRQGSDRRANDRRLNDRRQNPWPGADGPVYN